MKSNKALNRDLGNPNSDQADHNSDLATSDQGLLRATINKLSPATTTPAAICVVGHEPFSGRRIFGSNSAFVENENGEALCRRFMHFLFFSLRFGATLFLCSSSGQESALQLSGPRSHSLGNRFPKSRIVGSSIKKTFLECDPKTSLL